MRVTLTEGGVVFTPGVHPDTNTTLFVQVVNGVATDLKSSQPGVSASGQFHTLRLEATGDRLRAFLDGQFQFETRDSEFPTGRPAIATGNSKATFSSFVSYQP